MIFTVDANVFVAAALPSEPQHRAAATFLVKAAAQGGIFECPYLMLIEIAAAVARCTRNAALAQSLVVKTRATPNLRLHPLDARLTAASVHMATTHFLRGADAVYVALAHDRNSTLITLDQELCQRGGKVLPVDAPGEWLRVQGLQP